MKKTLFCVLLPPPYRLGELSALRAQKGKRRSEDGTPGGGGGGNGGGITFEEFQHILDGTSKLPTVKVPVGFD